MSDVTLFDLHEAAVSIIGAAVDAVVVVAPDGTIVFANEGAAELFGADDMVGRSVECLVPDRFRDRHQAHREGYQQDPQPRLMGERALDLQAQRADGSTIPVEISLSPIEVGERRYVMACMRDQRIAEFLSLPEGHKILGGLAIGHPRLSFKKWPERKPARTTWL